MNLSDYEVAAVLDVCGLLCPEPVMLLHTHILDVEPGQILQVRATDPSTRRDIPRFCQFLGHALMLQAEENGVLIFLIRRG